MLAIPQVKEKLPMLQLVCDEGFFDSASALTLEEVRRELRGIVKFLAGMARRKIIYRILSDLVTSVKYGVSVMPEEDFADYKLKVNRYLKQNPAFGSGEDSSIERTK
jgi:type I restriction enzyme R subunit